MRTVPSAVSRANSNDTGHGTWHTEPAMRDEADRIRQALDLYREGDFARAQMLLEMLDFDALSDDLHVEAHYLLGLVLVRRGDPLEAVACFQTCVKLEPRFFPALEAWGNVLAELGDARGAIEKYKRALTVAGAEQSGHVLFNYGQVLLKHGYPLRAMRKFREAFKRDESADAAYMTGVCYLEAGRARGAMKWLARAAELQPDSARNRVGLGNAHGLAGDAAEAERCYKRALELDPACHEAHYNWARELSKQGEHARAARLCKQGLRAKPDGFELLAHQAFCLRQMGAYDAALQAVVRMRQVLENAGHAERHPRFLDMAAANEAASLRGLGRSLQARTVLLAFLRYAMYPGPLSLAELRYHDKRRLTGPYRFELTVTVQMPEGLAGDAPPMPRRYHRNYWVIAADARNARRIVRELEPPEADVRFDPDIVVSEKLPDGDRGVTERSPAIPA